MDLFLTPRESLIHFSNLSKDFKRFSEVLETSAFRFRVFENSNYFRLAEKFLDKHAEQDTIS